MNLALDKFIYARIEGPGEIQVSYYDSHKKATIKVECSGWLQIKWQTKVCPLFVKTDRDSNPSKKTEFKIIQGPPDFKWKFNKGDYKRSKVSLWKADFIDLTSQQMETVI
jgi:hypothetical protein